MNNKLLNYWERLHSSFWFIPALMAGGAVLLAFGFLALDQIFEDLIERGQEGLLAWLYSGGAEGTRGLLSAIAGSSITVAGTTFSITIAALTLASNNYGPRLLRNFTSDTGNQVVLGAFVATFIYSLIVLRSVRGLDEITFVPHLSTTVALLLALVDIGVLIYFIHHISSSIRVSTIIANVSKELQATIDRIFPERIGRSETEDESHKGAADVPSTFEENSAPVAAVDSGYVQTIDEEALLRLASDRNIIVRVEHRPGEYVVKGNGLLRVWPDHQVDDDLCKAINNAFMLGKQRTIVQDVEFAMLQIVEIAVRALSPSLNDPYTAINCLDQLGTALCHLTDREFPSGYRYNDDNTLCIVAHPVTFEQLVDVAFDQIRTTGYSFVMVLTKLLDVIAVVASRVQSLDGLEALRKQAMLVEQSSHAGIALDADRQKVADRFETTLLTLRQRQIELGVNQAA